MVIRCERCSTLYDLDPALLSPSGSQVQCTRCQHVFTAYPKGANGATAAVASAEPEGAAAGAPAAPALPKARSAGARPTPPGGKPEPKPVRTAPPPVYRPAPPPAGATPPPVTRAPVLRRDAVGAFEARLRRSARMRWLAPVLAGGAVVAIAAAWALLSTRGDEGAARARREALATAALDDAGSLDKALARLEELERRAPAVRAVVAERALVQVLRASALADEGEALSVRLASRSADRERLRREQPAGWEEAERAAAGEVQALEPEVRAREERSRALASAALDALRRVQGEAGDTPEVARALALHHALVGGRERAEATARGSRGPDPWLELAAAWLEARHGDRAARERGAAALRSVASAHPEILRARFLLARTQAALGRPAEAVATLDALLAANARHEAAKRLRDELLAPPAQPAAVASAPAPGPVKPAAQPRKIVSPPAQPASAPPAEAIPAAAAATPPPPAAAAPQTPAPTTSPRTTPASTDGAGGARDEAPAPAARLPLKPAPVDIEPVPAVDGG